MAYVTTLLAGLLIVAGSAWWILRPTFIEQIRL